MGYKVVHTPRPIYEDIPLIGGNLAKLGRIIDLWHDPCSPTAVIWAYAYFQALPTLLMSLYKPELIDININHRSGKPRKGVKNVFKADQILNLTLIEIPVPRWVCFRVWELGQRIGYYFLVADATEDLAINWMTLAYKSAGCSSEYIAYVTAEQSHQLNGSSSGPGTTRLLWFTLGVSQIDWDAETAIILFPGKYRIGWEISFTPYEVPGQGETPYNTFVMVGSEVADIGEISVAEDGAKFASGSFLIDYDGGSPQPHISIHASWAHGTGYAWGTGTLSISRISDTDLQPDP